MRLTSPRLLVATLSLVAVSTSIQAAVRTQSVQVRLGSEGDVLAWLVAGPYPNEGALQLRGTGFRTDYLNSESGADPKEGDRSGAFAWKLATGTRAAGLDLNATMGNGQPAIGYCFVHLVSPRETTARLLFGSDDGAKVYLNGEKLFEHQVARGIRRDEEHVDLHLRAGDNRLLFKIEQGDGGWGLMARVVGMDGKPIPGLVERLDVSSEGRSESLLRSFVGKAGTLDLEAATLFEASARKADFWADRFRDEATDPDRLKRVVFEGRKALARAKDADAYSDAAQREYRRVEADYARARRRFLQWAQNPGPLFPTPAKNDVIVAPKGPGLFLHADGRAFVPVGYNHNPDWPQLEQENRLAGNAKPGTADKWFAHLAERGVNLIRLMVETPPSGNLEESVGVFRPEHVKWLDAVFTAARKHGVRLWVTPYDTFWMSLRADASPYWSFNGGPIHPENKAGFLTDAKVREAQKRRMRWLIDRYGNTDTLFAWEVMNEIDLWWGASPEQIRAWADDMIPYVRNYQRKKWGRDRLVTLSMAEPEPKGLNADTAFRHPLLDFATAHLYVGASRGPNPGQEIQAGRDFASGVRYALGQIRDGRPFMDGESGPIDRWVPEASRDDELFHQMSWAHLSAGGNGPGTRWPYRNPHHITEGMLDTLKGVRTFADGVPWKLLANPRRPLDFSGPWKGFGVRTDEAGIAWLQLEGVRAELDLPFRGGRIRLFDPRSGRWIEGTTVPNGIKEVAVVWTK